MRIRVTVEDEKGMVWAETERVVEEAVNENGYRVILHPNDDQIVYNVLNRAEDKINNWDKF